MSGEGRTSRGKAALASAQVAARAAVDVNRALVLPEDEEPADG